MYIMYQEVLIEIDELGNTIPVRVEMIDGEHIITIDGVEWARTDNQVHATVLFHMIADHITEYMTYKKN